MKKEAVILLALLLPATPALADDAGLSSPVLPHRVYDMHTGEIIDLEGLLGICADADVVTLGENHGDPATHLMELAILEGLDRISDGQVVLSMEMLERDYQDAVDKYINHEIDEDEFVAEAHLSETYKTNYRRLVNYCRRNDIEVVAADFPWDLGLKVGMMGYEKAVEGFTEEERQWLPKEYYAPDDAYKARHFKAMMSMPAHGGPMGMTPELAETYYQAQVLRDETMAESVYNASMANPGSTVYHIIGAFHVWDYEGTFERIRRRMPDGKLVNVLVIPVEDLLAPIPDDVPGCDYAIFVIGEPNGFL